MLLILTPQLVEGINPGRIPSWLKPLFDGAQRGVALHDAVQEVLAALGFTSLIYGLTTAAERNRDERFLCWTTAPLEWVGEYDRKSYIEIDPRVQHGWENVTPLIWDSRIGEDNKRVQGFLERAAFYGVGSGVVVFLRDARRSRVMVGFNSPERLPSDDRIGQITDRLGDYVLFGTMFHAIYMRGFIERGLPVVQRGNSLSPREIQCLELAARGQTSVDIAFKLGIVERTANFHFSNILTKLNAVNRAEAIAKALALGVID